MKDANEFLSRLIRNGIQLWVENGELRFRAPKDALTDVLRAELIEHKAEIVAFLDEHGKVSPTSYAQQRLWILDQLEPGSIAYNMPFAYRLHGRLDAGALEWSLKTIVDRHEALRTHFMTLAEQPVQVIPPFIDINLPVIDLSTFPKIERETKVQQILLEETRQLFHLECGPLIRAKLLHLGQEEHILFMNMHHIVSDGWSMGVLIRELQSLYSARLSGKPSPLEPLPIQYADFAVWQRDWLQGEALEEQLAYWKQRLGGQLPVLELPTDHPRPAVQTYQGAYQSLELSPTLSARLKSLNQQEGTTLFMILLAAFQVLLYRFSGQESIVVGTPIANRNQARIEGLIGFFVNTLVMRSDLSGKPSFRDLLRQMRESALSAYAHQDLPFEKLVEELHPVRNLSRPPLFQVFFNMVNLSLERLALPGLKVEPCSLSEANTKFDMTLYASDNGKSIQLNLLYNVDLFTPDRMAEMLRQFQMLLTQISEDPDEVIDHYSLVTSVAQALLPDPKMELACQWTGSVPDRFARQAERVGTNLAVVDPQERWTYVELEARSNQLANYLLDQGIHQRDVVAIYGHRSASLVWAILGTLKAGAAFVILDPAYPARRLVNSLQIAAPQGFLHIEGAGELPAELTKFTDGLDGGCYLELPTRSIAAKRNFLGDYSNTLPGIPLEADAPAYVACTSGTTGQSRAILGTHRPLAHFLDWHTHTFGLNENDRFSMLSGLAHDPLLRDIFTPLSLGATLYIPESDYVQSADQLAEWMRDEKINITHLTPAMGQVLATTQGKVILPALRYAFWGGDVLTQKNITQFRALAPNATCVNFYGATETPQAMGYFIVSEPDDGVKQNIPVGSGIQDVQLLVLNATRQLAGIGEIGEIYVRTPYLAQGYVSDAVATHRHFITNPLTNQTGDRLYRTGDLARYDLDGNVEFVGRVDNQVKIRGYRVELGEIEVALMQHPEIQECVVVALLDEESGDKRLIAYVVPQQPGTAFIIDRLRNFLKISLPDYMLPSAYVTLEKFPLTPNGKVDRQALPAPKTERPELGHIFETARTPTEELLAGIWAEVLNLDQVGIHDNFFDLGGHSLLATQVISRVCRALQVNLPLRSIFEAPTIAELALQVQMSKSQEHLSEIQVDDAPPISPISDKGELPLSFAQERLWFLDQLDPGNTTYHIMEAYRLNGMLEIAVLERSFNEMKRRHQSLRTTFTSVDGQPVQIIHPHQPFQFSANGEKPHPGSRYIDLRTLPKAIRQTEADRLVSEETQRPFNLSTGPLMRVTLIQLDEQVFVLALMTHHIISDGWSRGIFIRELTTLYDAFQNNQPSPLSELKIQYTDFAAWQRQRLQGNVLQAHLDYWKQQLKEVPILQLPTDHPRSATLTHPVSMHRSMLSPELTEALKKFCRREGVTIFMALLTAFKILLYRYTNQEDICVGSFVANRNRIETEDLIGFFVNNLALRTNLTGNPSVHELLRKVRDMTLDADLHQDPPFEKVLEAVQPQRSLSHAPFFQVMCVMQNFPISVYQLPDLTFHALPLRSADSDFDLTLWLFESDQRVGMYFGYNQNLFEAATIERMGGHLETLLENMLTNPGQRLSDLEMLTPAEYQQLVIAWNDTPLVETSEQFIHQVFEAQARKTPNAVALELGETQLSYAALDQRSSALADQLQTLGIGPGSLVGLYLERSLDAVVGFLGVLKAGGAYIPLDPQYPRERLDYMLADSQISVLLTHQRLLTDLPDHDAQVICLDTINWDEALTQTKTSFDEPAHLTPDNLAYIIYTSGSTGQPKGVRVPHRALMSYIEAVRPYLGLNAQDRVLQFASLSFDATTEELFPALLCGATVVLRPTHLLTPGSEFMQLITSKKLTILSLPVAFWHEWVYELARTQGILPESLRAVLLNAEEPVPEKYALWKELAGSDIRWINTYGPTETTVTATMFEPISAADKNKAWKKLPIGRPLANTRVYVLDRCLRPVPIGVPGELYIGGGGVTDGYLNCPDLTAQAFIPNPFSDCPGERLYKTGDLVRFLPDSNLEFLERVDFQVKIRGYRIELGEIETWLNQRSTIREATVLVRQDGSGPKQLVAYIIPDSNSSLSHTDESATRKAIQELRQSMKATLPEYMIPSAYVTLEEFPLTPNGKVDRQALQKMETILMESGETFVAPSTDYEEILAEIWSEVLKVERIGIHNNFFDLGGHSLLAMQILARVHDRFEIDLPVRFIFEAPTIAELALRVEQTLIADIQAMSAG